MLDKAIYILISILTISVVFDMININQTLSHVSKINRYIQLETDKEVSIVKNKFLFMEGAINRTTRLYGYFISNNKLLQLNPSLIDYSTQKYNSTYFTDSLYAYKYDKAFIHVNNLDQKSLDNRSNIIHLKNLCLQEKLIDHGKSELNGTGFCGLISLGKLRNFHDSIYIGSSMPDFKGLSSKLEVYLNDSLIGTSSHLSITIPQQKDIVLTTHYIIPSLDYTYLDTLITVKKYRF